MKMEITEKKENPLYQRTEVYFDIDHTGEATPGRNAVAEELSKQLKAKRDCIVVDCVESVYGIGKSKGYAKVYASKDAALKLERGYLLKRNGIEAPKAEAPAAEE